MWKSFYFSHSDADVSSCSVEKTETCNFIKNETLAQVFSCEFCEISKNSFFTANLRWLRPSLFMQTYCSEYFSETSTTYFLHEKKLIAFVGFLIKLPWNISNGGNVFLEMFFIKGKNVPGNGLWILSSRRWLTKLCLFYKIAVNKSPNYLYNYVSTDNQSYQTRSGSKFLHMCRRTEYFPNSLFPYTIKEWNTLCPVICKSVL